MGTTKTLMSLTLLDLTQVTAQESGADEMELRVWADDGKKHVASRIFEKGASTLWTLMGTAGLTFDFFDRVRVDLWELDPGWDDAIGCVRHPGSGAGALQLTGVGATNLVTIKGDGCSYRLRYRLVAAPTSMTSPTVAPGSPAGAQARVDEWFFAKELAIERGRKANSFLWWWSAQAGRTAWTGLCKHFGGEAPFRALFVQQLLERVEVDASTGFPTGAVRVDQMYLNICGLAATEVLAIACDPLRFAYLMVEVFQSGRLPIQGGVARASQCALEKPYVAWLEGSQEVTKKTKKAVTYSDVSVVEWTWAMTLASWLTDVGDETKFVGGNGGAVMPSEAQELMHRVLLCRAVWHEGTSVTESFSTPILENALVKLNAGKYEFGLLFAPSQMFENQGAQAINVFVEWNHKEVLALLKSDPAAGDVEAAQRLFVTSRLEPPSPNSVVPAEAEHTGSYWPAKNPKGLSGNNAFDDWDHIVAILPYKYVEASVGPARRYLNWGVLGLPQAAAADPGKANMVFQDVGGGVTIWILCIITWGTIRWIAVDDTSIAAWFGAVTLGRRA